MVTAVAPELQMGGFDVVVIRPRRPNVTVCFWGPDAATDAEDHRTMSSNQDGEGSPVIAADEVVEQLRVRSQVGSRSWHALPEVAHESFKVCSHGGGPGRPRA